MSPDGQRLLDQIPVMLRGNHQYRASFNAQGDELRLLNESVDRFVNGLCPLTADSQFLGLFESLLGLGVANPLITLAQRRAVVLAFLGRMAATGSAMDWKMLGDRLIGTGWSYRWNEPGDVTSPAPNNVLISLPYPAASMESQLAQALFASITAASVIISYTFSDVFRLDVSTLDSATGLLG